MIIWIFVGNYVLLNLVLAILLNGKLYNNINNYDIKVLEGNTMKTKIFSWIIYSKYNKI